MVSFHRQRQLSHERETDTLWRGGGHLQTTHHLDAEIL